MRKKLTKGFCIKLTPEEHSLLERASAQVGRSMGQLIRELLHAYLEPQMRAGQLWPTPQPPVQDELL